MVKLI